MVEREELAGKMKGAPGPCFGQIILAGFSLGFGPRSRAEERGRFNGVIERICGF